MNSFLTTGSCLLLAILMEGLGPLHAAPRHETVIAYLFPQERLLKPQEIAAGKLTRINYAFANLKKGRVVAGFAHDRENLRTLTAMKKQFPHLQVLISVGGWTWSGGFSDAALSVASRRRFINSAVQFIRDNGLDGIDIDWEYPGLVGNGNKYRREDKQNYTALLKELRARLDQESQLLGRPLLTSIAAGASDEFVDNTDLRSVARYVNSVNLMSYDYYVPAGDGLTGHHAPLHENPADPKHVSAQSSVEMFEKAGVPAAKLVLGVPFYGHAWTHVDAVHHGLFQRGKKSAADPDYKTITELLSSGEYERFWDPIALAPYLYSASKRTFITYEDPQSLSLKCRYVLQHHLGGIMFWEYSNDPAGTLLNAIARDLHSGRTRAVRRY